MIEDTKVVNGMSEDNAIEALKKYRDETGKSQSTITNELGLSSGAVSSFLSGNYKTPHTIIPKIEALLSIREPKDIA